MNKKTVKTSGADELTPSRSEYFSWINHTNEGSTLEQTTKNLNFFKYLHDTFGMTLDIYAWDAGNLDGAGNSYESETSEKIKKQYPQGYAPIVQLAKTMNTRMGVWGGPDGYGDTAEEGQARQDLLVHLCKDYDWALFKFDMVCGGLRENMRKQFAKTLTECRKYSKDLILLNHRIDLGDAEKYSTTFLWEGMETYTDVHAYNRNLTAPHNRGYIFSRGHTPEYKRLTEDHGVCISSSVDFFEDDLVYQAFNRCLILAPEIYGNPWLIRDDELAVLARIFNLHRRYRDILVNAMTVNFDIGENGVLRGDLNRRFLCTGSGTWNEKVITLPLDSQIGLAPCDKVVVVRRFPTEKVVGCFNYGESINLTLLPFRACLFEICSAEVCDDIICGCEYEVLHETNGKIDKINILKSENEIYLYRPKTDEVINRYQCKKGDISLQNPQKIASLKGCELPKNDRFLYESAYFALDNDSLEKRSLRRSGESEIPAVKEARDAFFNQHAYVTRGTDGERLFNQNENLVYDIKSISYINHDNKKGFRCDGGALRVDMGEVVCADRVEIEFFSARGENAYNFEEQTVCDLAESSVDLASWQKSKLLGVQAVREQQIEHIAYYCDQTIVVDGVRQKAVFEVDGSFRYFILPSQPDRLFSFKAYFKGQEVKPTAPKANNLFAPYNKKITKNVSSAIITPKNLPLHPYIAVAVEGITGNENVCVVATVDGKVHHFPNRAPAYPANPFEYPVHPVDGYYTFYLPIKEEWQGKEIEITALFAENRVDCDIYLCDGHGKRIGQVLKV